MSIEVEADPYEAGPSHSRRLPFWRRLGVRMTLLIGVVLFLLGVSIDSSQQSASAAHMPAASVVSMPFSGATDVPAVQAATPPEVSYRVFDADTARKLSRSELTRASLTRSRLTSAHFFTEPLQ